MSYIDYKSYVGQYGKRFYTPFNKASIFKLKAFRNNQIGVAEFLYQNNEGKFWADCEDTCIITNEIPIQYLDWVANVNSAEYKGYNPFTGLIVD